MWRRGWGWGKVSSQCIATLRSYAIDSLWPFTNKEVDVFFTQILRYYNHIFKINLHLEIIGFEPMNLYDLFLLHLRKLRLKIKLTSEYYIAIKLLSGEPGI